MFAWLGNSIYNSRRLVLAAGLAFMVLSGVVGIGLFGDLKAGGYNNPDAESTRVEEVMKAELGQSDRTLVVLFTSQDGTTVDNPAFKSAVEAAMSKADGQPNVESITTFYNTGAASLVSNDRTATYAVVGLDGDDNVQLENMERLRPLLTSDTLRVQLGGYTAVSQEINELVQRDLERAETFTLPIVFVLLVIIFGSLVAASLPLFTGGLAILGAILILRLTTAFADISIFAVNVVTMLGLGLAIDYSLFMVSRFREELVKQDGDVRGSLVRTMQTAGRTVIFSGLTVMISLLSLLAFPQMFLKSLGWGGAAAVMVAMIGSVTVLPAILALMGKRVNSLSILSLLPAGIRARLAPKSDRSADTGLWYKLSRFVMRRPVLSLLVAVIPLLIAGLPFLRINLSIPDHRALPEGSESRIVGDALANDFPSNETLPVQIVVETSQPALSGESLALLLSYTQQLKAVPGVTRVDSLVTLDPRLDAGGSAAYEAFYAQIGAAGDPRAVPAAAAAARYANGDYSLVNVLYSDEPLGPEAQELVRQIRAVDPPAGISALVGGYTAELDDFLASLLKSIPFAMGLIVIVMFLLLFLMLGSIVVPLKAVILTILSLSASFGALVWIFQDGNLSGFLGFTPLGSIDGTMPVLIFAVAFGLSMDYEVFLLSRIKEAYDQTGDTTKAVATGVQRTGGIITSAALLLVVVIAGFAMGEVLFVKQVGLGLALAIFVDATLVRTLLVPATMRLLGRYNWWAPKPMMALYNRLGLSESDSEAERGANKHDAEPQDAAPARTATKSDQAEAGA